MVIVRRTNGELGTVHSPIENTSCSVPFWIRTFSVPNNETVGGYFDRPRRREAANALWPDVRRARLLTQQSRRPHETDGSAFSPYYVAWSEYIVRVSNSGALPNGDPKSDQGSIRPRTLAFEGLCGHRHGLISAATTPAAWRCSPRSAEPHRG